MGCSDDFYHDSYRCDTSSGSAACTTERTWIFTFLFSKKLRTSRISLNISKKYNSFWLNNIKEWLWKHEKLQNKSIGNNCSNIGLTTIKVLIKTFKKELRGLFCTVRSSRLNAISWHFVGVYQPSLACPVSAASPSFFSHAVVAHSTGVDNSGAEGSLRCLLNKVQPDTNLYFFLCRIQFLVLCGKTAFYVILVVIYLSPKRKAVTRCTKLCLWTEIMKDFKLFCS